MKREKEDRVCAHFEMKDVGVCPAWNVDAKERKIRRVRRGAAWDGCSLLISRKDILDVQGQQMLESSDFRTPPCIGPKIGGRKNCVQVSYKLYLPETATSITTTSRLLFISDGRWLPLFPGRLWCGCLARDSESAHWASPNDDQAPEDATRRTI